MQSALAQAMPVGNSDRPKRARANGNDQHVDTEADHRLLITASKLVSHLATRSRQQDALLLHTLLMGDDTVLMQAATMQGKQWAAARKAGNATGVPYLLLHCKIVVALVEDKKVMEKCSEQHNILALHAQTVTDPMALEGHIVTCKVSKAYEKGNMKLQYSFSMAQAQVCEAIFHICEKVYGATRKRGPAPRTKHERDLIAQLVDMGEYQQLDGEA